LSQSTKAGATTSVPIKVAGNTIFVPILINESQRSFLVLDTGSEKTILSPALMERLRVSIPTYTPRWTVRLLGDRTVSMPFARVRSLKVGDLPVEDLGVGVYDVFPTAQGAGGLLGADFLNHLRITIDRNSARLRLEVAPPKASDQPPARDSGGLA
jgi:hypothetical protein